MGMRTYGKASVQSVIPLSDGSALRLTIAHYFTPSGRMIQRNEETGIGGIVPDFVVPVSPEAEEKIYRQWDELDLKAEKPAPSKTSETPVADPIYERAIELLKARRVLGSLSGRGG
jgi:carboxyl-terminal processing protease